MNAPVSKSWSQDRFFAWAEAQDIRYEFDGSQPVAMTGGNARHSAITVNLQTALRTRLREGRCRSLGPDAGVGPVNNAVRYPDAVVTCSDFDLAARTVPGVVVAFEVLSPHSGRIDRIIKVREYAAISSVRRYVLLESTGVGLTVLERSWPSDPWRSSVLTGGDVLRMPEIGAEIPVAELYEDITFPEDAESSD